MNPPELQASEDLLLPPRGFALLPGYTEIGMRSYPAVIIALLICLEPAFGAEQAWVLHQNSKLRGDQTLTISASGMKHECLGVVVIASAPKWNVTLYNVKSKKFVETSIANFGGKTGLYSDLMTGEYFTVLRVHPAREKMQKQLGMSTQHFIMRSNKQPIGAAANSVDQAHRWVPSTEIISADFYTAHPLPMPDQVQQLLKRIYRMPPVSGIPFKLTYVDSTGHEAIELTTKKVERTNVTATCYSIPIGYKRTTDMSEVAVVRSQKQMQNVAGFFESWRESTDKK